MPDVTGIRVYEAPHGEEGEEAEVEAEEAEEAEGGGDDDDDVRRSVVQAPHSSLANQPNQRMTKKEEWKESMRKSQQTDIHVAANYPITLLLTM